MTAVRTISWPSQPWHSPRGKSLSTTATRATTRPGRPGRLGRSKSAVNVGAIYTTARCRADPFDLPRAATPRRDPPERLMSSAGNHPPTPPRPSSSGRTRRHLLFRLCAKNTTTVVRDVPVRSGGFESVQRIRGRRLIRRRERRATAGCALRPSAPRVRPRKLVILAHKQRRQHTGAVQFGTAQHRLRLPPVGRADQCDSIPSPSIHLDRARPGHCVGSIVRLLRRPHRSNTPAQFRVGRQHRPGSTCALQVRFPRSTLSFGHDEHRSPLPRHLLHDRRSGNTVTARTGIRAVGRCKPATDSTGAVAFRTPGRLVTGRLMIDHPRGFTTTV